VLYLRELVAPGEITEEVRLRFMENDSTGWIESQALLRCGYYSNASELTQRRGPDLDEADETKVTTKAVPNSASVPHLLRRTAPGAKRGILQSLVIRLVSLY